MIRSRANARLTTKTISFLDMAVSPCCALATGPQNRLDTRNSETRNLLLYRYQNSIANVVVVPAPANRVTAKAGHPDHERDRIPYRNQRHLSPDALLLHAPDSDQPGDDHSQHKVA